ncbi:replication initiator protein [Microvirus sp.]|nr:replication initiator protein [Microvirus sp.]
MFIKDSVYSQRTVSDVKSPVACFHPNLVFNQYLGDYVLVPCRICAACRSSYARDLQNRIETECRAHKFNFFITLTYDNVHMPMYYAFPSEDGVYFRAFRGNKPMLDSQGLELPELDFDLSDSWYAEPQHNPYQTGFGFCHKPDIQKFIKRLRIKLIRTYGNVSKSKIRYFIASEYGPSTQRPHYHGIIFCDDEQIARDMPRLIFESWALCSDERCDVQLISGACPQYVAKYVNGFASLPKVLQTKLTKPFHLASKNPALGSFKIDEKDIFDCFVNNNFERPVVDAKTGEVAFNLFPYKVLSRFFRRYCGYSEGNRDYELRLFQKYATGNYVIQYDSDNHRYIECSLRGDAYLNKDGSFKYKDYLWFKCVSRLLHSSFTFPKRNEFGYVVGMHENVTFTLDDILNNMRNMYNNYNLYLLNSYYRSQEVLSSGDISPFEKLAFYPLLWKLFPNTCNKYQFNCKPFYNGKTLSFYFRQLGISYDSVFEDGFIRTDVYNKIIDAPFIKRNQDKLLTQIQQSDYKKKFNDLYKFK